MPKTEPGVWAKLEAVIAGSTDSTAKTEETPSNDHMTESRDSDSDIDLDDITPVRPGCVITEHIDD